WRDSFAVKGKIGTGRRRIRHDACPHLDGAATLVPTARSDADAEATGTCRMSCRSRRGRTASGGGPRAGRRVDQPDRVVGPVDEAPSRMGTVLLALWRRRLPAVVAGGFDWVDVRDVVAALLRRGPRPYRRKLPGRRAPALDPRDGCARLSLCRPRVASVGRTGPGRPGVRAGHDLAGPTHQEPTAANPGDPPRVGQLPHRRRRQGPARTGAPA